MITISLCMIVKNEAAILQRCLKSIVPAMDEIIIVDTGSTDDTKKIASGFTEKVYDFPWIDNFSAVRNFSFAKATMDYCLWMDADDILTKDNLSKLIQLKKTLTSEPDMVMMKYATGFSSDGTPTFIYYRERLIKNHAGFIWNGWVHECITPTWNTIHEDIIFEHRKIAVPINSDRNLKIYEKMKNSGLAFSVRDTYYYARELYYHGKYTLAGEKFIQVIYNPQAWSENRIEACRMLAKCYEATNKPDEMLEALFKSFSIDTPRAEILYDIGSYFQKNKDFNKAIYWFELALSCQADEEKGGFIEKDYYGYLPCLQLCVCYFAAGDIITSYKYHKKTGQWHTDTPEYIYNENYFNTHLVYS